MTDWPQPSGRVVVTGIGAVTPLGTGVEEFWSNLTAGQSGIGPIDYFDTSEFPTRIAAQVRGFNAEEFLDKKDARRIDRFIAYGVAGATMALQDSGFPLSDDNREFVGCLIGSGIGGLTFMGEQYRRLVADGPSRVSPFLVPFMIPDMASGLTSIVHGLKGPNTCVVTACATGANSIGDAYHMIKRGDALAMVCGGTEAPVNEISLAGFCSARAMTTNNEAGPKASRPFDLNRDGFVMGEGSGVLVLEDYDHALARGAKMYGEVIGYGMTGDAYHITSPDPESDGATRGMRMALRTARLEPSDIDYINAHGTSTPYNDKGETRAIKQAFGDQAYKIPVSSTKSAIGHTLGAAGAIESIICLLAMRDQLVPPTINYETPDPDCDLDYVPNVARKVKVDITLTNSFGFGGHNATLVFKRL